jgi:hypothetical protein
MAHALMLIYDIWSFLLAAVNVINALAVVVLVFVTAWYAKSTAKILEETRKTTKAIERQAEAAEKQLKALHEQMTRQAVSEKAVIANVMQKALSDIEYWQSANIPNLATSRQLPQQIDLVPADAGMALLYVSHVSRDAWEELQAAFTNLRYPRGELEIFRHAHVTDGSFFETHIHKATENLRLAAASLEVARSHLQTTVHQAG